MNNNDVRIILLQQELINNLTEYSKNLLEELAQYKNIEIEEEKFIEVLSFKSG